MSFWGWIALFVFSSTSALLAFALIVERERKPRQRKAVCCEHNRCPDRPDGSAEYESRPWRCPQCRRWWITEERTHSHSGSEWLWKEVKGPHED